MKFCSANVSRQINKLLILLRIPRDIPGIDTDLSISIVNLTIDISHIIWFECAQWDCLCRARPTCKTLLSLILGTKSIPLALSRGSGFATRYRLSFHCFLQISFAFLFHLSPVYVHILRFSLLTRENRRNCHHFHWHFVHLALTLVRVQIWYVWVHWSRSY